MQLPKLKIISFAAIVILTAPLTAGSGRTLGDGPKTKSGNERRISIVFAGDLMQHLPQVEAARTDSGYSYYECFRHVAPLFHGSDLTVVNLETTLAASPPYSGYPTFRAPGRLAADMRAAGIDVALLANNHICDKGSQGIYRTIAALDSAGIYNTGAFVDSVDFLNRNPLIVDRNGFRITLLNYTYGTNGIPVPGGSIVNLIDTAAISRDLALIEPAANGITVVCLHWGNEYQSRPSPAQESLLSWLRKKGVDFVVGSHPHVIQPVRLLRDEQESITGVAAFSLGNFISNQPYYGTDGGMVLRLNISMRDEETRIEPEIAYVWSYKPYRNGKRRYEIIPSYHAAELLKDDSVELRKYEHFIRIARLSSAKEDYVREIEELVITVKPAPLGNVRPFDSSILPFKPRGYRTDNRK